ncbi:MAG: EamA family transporter [Opitutales bacterium]
MGYLILVSLIWALPFGLISVLVTEAGVSLEALPFLRLGLALLVFLPFMRIDDLNTRERWQLGGIGAVQYGLMYVLLFHSFAYLPAWQVALFTVFTPFYVAGIYDVLERRFNLQRFLLTLLAVTGAAIIVFDREKLREAALLPLLEGFLYMQLCNLCFAGGQVAYRQWRERMKAIKDAQVYGLLYTSAALVAGVYWVVLLVAGEGSMAWTHMTPAHLGILIYLGVVSSGLCFFWWNRGATQVRPGTLAVFNNLKVPLGVIGALLITGTVISVPQLLAGGLLIALAIYLSERRPPKMA